MSSEAVGQLERPVDVDEDVDPESCEYVLGPATYRKYCRLETKPGSGRGGGGYERFRSYEDLETQPGGKRDVYVYHHRLLALLHPDVDDLPIGEALEYLEGRDVHHENGVKWDNRLENFELLEHARHSSITQRELQQIAKARAADAKRARAEETEDRLGADVCPGCGTETDTLATSPGFEGERCLDCAMSEADGATIEL